MINLFLASPRGYCAGVTRAIAILDKTLKLFPKKQIVVNHEIIHNKLIINYYLKKGVIFEENLDLIDQNSIMIFSAHGVSPQYIKKVSEKGIKYIDASCPLVIKVHNEAKKYLKNGYKIIYIGQKTHQEALGILGENEKNIFIIENNNDIDILKKKITTDKLVLLTQTTLSVDDKQSIEQHALKVFPKLEKPTTSDICYATTNRQNAIKEALKNEKIDLLIIIGSQNSSNSNKLKNIGNNLGINSVLIDEFKDFNINNLNGINNILLSSGASVSHKIVSSFIKEIEKYNVIFKKEIKVIEEKIHFPFDLKLN